VPKIWTFYFLFKKILSFLFQQQPFSLFPGRVVGLRWGEFVGSPESTADLSKLSFRLQLPCDAGRIVHVAVLGGSRTKSDKCCGILLYNEVIKILKKN
jgi:hypothetical protein